MAEVPEELKYTESHEWLRVEDDGSVIMGITDHAQEQLGDLVFVELPEPGRVVQARDDFAVVESVKAASDVYAPVAGEVIAVNDALNDSPELINEDPYGRGWMIRIRPSGDAPSTLDAAAYAKVAASEEH